MSQVHFFYSCANFTFNDRTKLKSFINLLFKREDKRLSELNYIFCTDEYLLAINQQFLKHDDYTDIITFDLSADPDSLIGEIYISIDRVRENALSLGLPFKTELHRVLFHGALHLCGYGDKTKGQVQQMRKKEDEYLAIYFQA